MEHTHSIRQHGTPTCETGHDISRGTLVLVTGNGTSLTCADCAFDSLATIRDEYSIILDMARRSIERDQFPEDDFFWMTVVA